MHILPESPVRSSSPLEDVAGPHTGALSNRAPCGARFFMRLMPGSRRAVDRPENVNFAAVQVH